MKSGWTQSARLLGSVQGVVVQAIILVEGSSSSGKLMMTGGREGERDGGREGQIEERRGREVGGEEFNGGTEEKRERDKVLNSLE